MSGFRQQYSSIFFLGIIFLAPGTAFSEEASSDTYQQVPTVTVVGEEQRANTTTSLNREEIEAKRSAVAYDALDYQPGLNIVRRLGMTGAGLSRLSIRGNGSVGPAGIQVYVDGRPDATVSFAHPTPSAMGLAEAEYIEVIHGPSPVLHGSGKTGVVNIVTADPEPGLHSFLELSYGSFNTQENFARVSSAGDKGYVRLSVSDRGTDGDNPNSEVSVKSFNLKGKYKFNDTWDATFTAAQNEDHFEVFNEFFVPGPFTDPRTKNLDLTQTVFDLTFNADFGNAVSSLKFFHDDLDPKSQVLDGTEQRADVSEKGFRFKTTWAASKQTKVITGIDYLKAEADNSPVLPPFGTPKLTIPRARVSEELDEKAIYVFADHAVSDSVAVSGGLRHTNHSEAGDVQSGELGIVFTPENGTTFRARATRGYQAPTLQQLFGVFRGGRKGPANPNLDHENIKQIEIGFNKAFPKGDIDLVVYKQKGDDLIGIPAVRKRPTPPPPGLPPLEIQNDVSYSNHGIEAKLHYELTNNLKTMLGITIADFDQDTNRFLRVPEKTVDMGITYKHSIKKKDDLSVSLFGRYASGAVDVAVVPQFPLTPNGPQVDLGNYFVADLKINYHVNDNLKVFFGIDNITDENYALVTGIPSTSLGAYAGISLTN